MRRYLHNTPAFVKWLYPNRVWDIKSTNSIYLTFDDGPHPEATSFVLEELDRYQSKATFFCIGEKVKQYPEILETTISKGHNVGNHTNNHLNGSKSSFDEYIKNVERCHRTLNEVGAIKGKRLFRPPYGRLTGGQAKYVGREYAIIMWDNLIGDFDQTLSSRECLRRAIANIRAGSIVVFHDSQKSFGSLKNVLPDFLKAVNDKGLISKALSSVDLHPQ